MIHEKLSIKVRRISFLVLILSLIIVPLAGADPLTVSHDPGIVTDDPSGEEHFTGFDGSGYSYVEAYLGSQAPANRADRKARNISLVGALQLSPFNAGVHADVAGYKNLAFVGKWRGACPGTGVDIIDISKPKAPVKIADTNDYPDTSMEDMQVISINGRDILAIGLQDCGNVVGVGTVGMELYDISNPSSPVFLSLFNGADFGQPATLGHVHEFDLAKTPGGKTLALLASPDLEAITSDDAGLNGTGDLLIVDISDPRNPALIGEWGVLDEPTLGVPFYLNVRQGGDARTLLHSVRANANGTRAYLSYWDAGFITLDLSDPTSPVFLSHAPNTAPGDSYAAGEEGNAHSADEAQGGNLLVAADEDFTPFASVFSITSGPNTGNFPAAEGAFTKPIVNLADRSMNGSVTYIGLACAGPVPAAPDDGNPLTDEIALALRGVCFFQDKASVAEAAGYDGFIVMNDAARGDALVLMGGSGAVPVPQIPGVFVGHSTGLKICGVANEGSLVVGMTCADTAASAVFNGWGYLRFFDISDPANPVQLSTFATANTNNPAVATSGTWSVHNPEVRGNTVFASWYSDGVRVIDISQPSAPREIGFWTGLGAPSGAPAVNIWSVVPHGDLLLVSDRNFGLYILKLKP